MGRIEAVLFDLGRTLVDYGEEVEWPALGRVTHAIYDYLDGCGYKLPPFGRFKRRVYRALAWGRLCAKLRGRETPAADICTKTILSMNDRITRQDLDDAGRAGFAHEMVNSKLMPGALEALRSCREGGYRLAIVSNTVLPEWILREDLERRDLLDFFDVVVFSSVHGRPKPHPSIFKRALDALGVKAPQSVFVGDNWQADIVGASRVGMHAIWLNANGHITPRHATPDAVIRSLLELPGVLAGLET